jgi:hypothetical protein
VQLLLHAGHNLLVALGIEHATERRLVAAALRRGNCRLLAFGRHAGARFLDLRFALLGDVGRKCGGGGIGRPGAPALLAVEALLPVRALLPIRTRLSIRAGLSTRTRLRILTLTPISAIRVPLLRTLVLTRLVLAARLFSARPVRPIR